MDNFSESTQKTVTPEANIPDATEDSNLATDDDFDLAMWFWSTIIEMYERAAEFDGSLAKPREPNFVAWLTRFACFARSTDVATTKFAP